MNILIIGGTGVLSTAITAEALKRGIKVTMINRGNRRIPDGVELIKSDKGDVKRITTALNNRTFDAVIDCLCYTDEQTKKSVELYSKYTSQYFFISSCAVYDTETLAGKQGDEESPKVLSVWSYSVNKWKSEQLLNRMFERIDCNFTIIRPCVTYGNTRIPYGISPQYGYHWTLIARILANKPIVRWNGGINRCNMMRVEDFAVGVVGLIGNSQAMNEAFNICGDETPSFNDVLDCVAEIIGHKIITIDITSEFYAENVPNRAGEILGGRSIDALNSNQKVKDAVPAFKQTISLKEGIRRTIESYQSENYQRGIDWRFDAECDRVIHRWCKSQKMNESPYHIGFVDYLGNAKSRDKLAYYMEYHKGRLDITFLNLCLRVLSKIKRTINHKKA